MTCSTVSVALVSFSWDIVVVVRAVVGVGVQGVRCTRNRVGHSSGVALTLTRPVALALVRARTGITSAGD